MNLLAHLHLSDGLSPAAAAGNLLADYMDRVGASPPDADFAEGIRIHRSIDAFTDSHPAIRAARAALVPPFRRVGGVVVDLACDCFLTRDWPRYHSESLRAFVAVRMAEIQRYFRAHASPLRPLVNHIAADKWLLSYGTSDGLKTAFERISHRSPVAAALRGAEMEIERRQATLQAAFDEFYPQAMARFLKPNGPHGPLPALAETSP